MRLIRVLQELMSEEELLFYEDLLKFGLLFT